jgi:hypothetical protein
MLLLGLQPAIMKSNPASNNPAHLMVITTGIIFAALKSNHETVVSYLLKQNPNQLMIAASQ